MTQHKRGTWSMQAGATSAGLYALLLLAPAFVTAQMISPPSNQSPQQNQPGQNLQAPGTIPIPNPLAQQSAISSTASGASAPQSNTIPSSRGKSFGTIGQGLPGMTGGPALNGPTGSQDPAARYMRPTVIPPLFCDPAINIPC
ncbi:MAG: hypothetical protein GDA65_11050 [Nitrospira sp. CR1.1]|nr:hypothetical protein [Nitrospira sp. CR1.1]